jgi:putative peptide zinc metalloprotease protein
MSDSDNSEWKPKLSHFVNIRERDGCHVLSNTQNGQRLLVNDEVIHLVRLLDGSKTLDDILKTLAGSAAEINNIPVANFIKVNLGQRGFLEEYEGVQHKSSSLVKLKIPIIPSKVLNSFSSAQFLHNFYNGHFFYIIFTILFSLHLFSFIQSGYRSFDQLPLWLGIFLFLSHIIHELGHALACRSFGASAGTIGFGFYSIFPVFYIDLSDTWNLPARQRIRINLGGILADYFLALICLIIYFLTDNESFLIAETLIFFKTFFNLNFLLRTDGYWVLSDILRLPNLADNSRLYVMNLISQKAKRPNHKAEWFLAIYGALSSLFLIILIFFLLSNISSLGADIDVIIKHLDKTNKDGQPELKAIIASLTKIIITVVVCYLITRSYFLLLLHRIKAILWKKR